ncbi:peptidase M1 [Niastella koreensis]|uniref:Aminopeptidase N n=2 Tax=Niastella koreensis TaxID=354356 RepID=G8TKM1_NIAKG|nr:M1 family metallopeptidase [Niastella koreensis]AEV98695.1 Peptidase M1 membrane alanine aminopeptidase [Niastella koreensis GR20-10]OQP44938.1 peptidase M1 [Niastella koreensis]
MIKTIVLNTFFYCFILLCCRHGARAQAFNAEIINDLVHTKLDISFDYKKCYVYGKEGITIKPHCYPTDSLRLDAKGMDIHKVCVIKGSSMVPLTFTYDNLAINIHLDRVYHANESYTVHIDYTAKPNERKGIRKNEKGIYFINPQGEEKDKPTQIWTEGEPESSSGWFPTIDKPDQKTTSEINMTVPSKYVTLSNGKLVSQKNNPNGTRTDTWKMALPNAPYLFMMAVGDFKIYHDHWRGKEVSYYLDPKYAPYAKQIFGQTPEAMEFFSKTLGVDFPWNKEAAIAVSDYISVAMENTTATVFGNPYQTSYRELADQDYNATIPHELFHQWFGDYVTAKNWANLTMNESFADFGEIIWLEYKYGKDVAGEHLYKGLQEYLRNKRNFGKALVNYNYKVPADMFNGVTYQKGGRILNMLRNYLGNEAFYKGLHLYLTTNAFKNAEATQLRLAMEEASGSDLNWFFNQWYFGAGHPVLKLNYQWDSISKTATVYVAQEQDGQIFKLPLAVDIYSGGKKVRHKVWIRNKNDTLKFHSEIEPDLVNVDADKVLVCQKTDIKPLAVNAYQYFHAPLYLDRFEALEAAQKNQKDSIAQRIIFAALNDPFPGLRKKAIMALDLSDSLMKTKAEPTLAALAQNERNNQARSAALLILARYREPRYLPLFDAALKSESYTVQAAAIFGIAQIDEDKALKTARKFENDNAGELTEVIFHLYAKKADVKDWPYLYRRYTAGTLQEKVSLLSEFTSMMNSVKDPTTTQQGIAVLREMAIKYKTDGLTPYIIKSLDRIKEAKEKQNDSASVEDVINAKKDINMDGK